MLLLCSVRMRAGQVCRKQPFCAWAYVQRSCAAAAGVCPALRSERKRANGCNAGGSQGSQRAEELHLENPLSLFMFHLHTILQPARCSLSQDLSTSCYPCLSSPRCAHASLPHLSRSFTQMCHLSEDNSDTVFTFANHSPPHTFHPCFLFLCSICHLS